MDFVRLGERYTTAYIPDKLIEGYNSLIWTERNLGAGEFELKSFDVAGLKALLPEDTLVSHLETQEVCIVETHEINMVGEGQDAEPELTIRGRTARSIFESRWVESTYQKKRTLRQKYSATSAAGVLMWNAVVNSSGKDVTRGDTDPDTQAMKNDYPWTTLDVLPNVFITESVAAEGELRWWQLEEGILDPQLIAILDNQKLSVRTIRPVSPNPATVITVDSVLATRGTIRRTFNADVPGLRFDIYQGTDKSAIVKFSQLQGHLENPAYLLSSKDMKTVVEVMTAGDSIGDIYRPGEEGLTGWRRKTMGFDAGSPDGPPQPERPDEPGENATRAQRLKYRKDLDAWKVQMGKWRNKWGGINAAFRAEAVKRATRELAQARRVNMVTGDISTQSPYKYKVDYDLGDTVTLVGDYGVETQMVVSEYVRTENSEGDRGFPGFVEP